MSHRICIVEDHPLMRTVMQEFVDDHPDMEVVSTVESGEQAVEALEQTTECRPDVLLVDVALPGMSGIELVRRVTDRWPNIRCIMLSGHVPTSYVERAFAAGAVGYLPKGQPEDVVTAIRRVLARGAHAPD